MSECMLARRDVLECSAVAISASLGEGLTLRRFLSRATGKDPRSKHLTVCRKHTPAEHLERLNYTRRSDGLRSQFCLRLSEFADNVSKALSVFLAHLVELNSKLPISCPTHKCLLNLDRERLAWWIDLQS